jgi:glycosyltransferase involved in cell wall biosynthesis
MNAIYYCTRRGTHSGGEAVNEDHVLALRDKGYRAYLFYIEDTPIGHFAARAPVLRAGNSMAFAPRDVIVVPEPWKLHIDGFAPMDVKKVMHCQNPYYLFNGVDDVSQIAQKGISAVITCSDYTTGLLRRAGFDGALQTIQPALSGLFKPGAQKKLQIAYMPRKREYETSFVKGLFRSMYPDLRDIPWVPIHNMSLEECARTLDESAIFAAFSYIEGLGLPPLEAMASGCVVVGFNGLGGADYATPHNGLWINEGDHFGFAHALAEALRAAANATWLASLQQHAKATAARYSMDHFRGDLYRFWDTYLGEDKHEYLLGSD